MPASTKALTTDVLIVGAGLTGLSAAYHCDSDYVLVEASEALGGAAGTFHHNGFHLDRGVHILYFRDPRTREWISDELDVELTRYQRKSVVYMNGIYAPYPVQFNLASFPWPQRLKYGTSLLFASNRGGKVASLANWARANFGSALAADFFIPYNEKLWGVNASELTTEWMDGYVPNPSLRSAISGMMRSPVQKHGTNAEFWYPKAGGIDSLARAIEKRLKPILRGQRLIGLDLRSKTAVFSTGLMVTYRKLVSTIPLKKLLGYIDGVPATIQELRDNLTSSGTTFAHFLIKRSRVGDNWHWIYVPDSSIPFYRVTLPHNIGENNCPDGWSALTLEFGGLQTPSEALEQASKNALVAMGLMTESDIDCKAIWDSVNDGYVTYDTHISEARSEILTWLASHDVLGIGRYGRWEYSNMESALLQGRSVARRLDGSHYANPESVALQRPKLDTVRDYFANSYIKQQGSSARVLLRRGEVDRRRQLSQWIPQWEGLSVLDAGCGDGTFLKRILHGVPSHIRVEDCVAGNVESAYQLVQHLADSVSCSVTDSICVASGEKFDVVLALGVFDYEAEWEVALGQLIRRCRHALILDIPKWFTLHSLVRIAWLKAHKVDLHTASRRRLEELLSTIEEHSIVAETPLHWIVRIDCSERD